MNGKVSHLGQPLSNVTVTAKGTDTVVITDGNGQYQIGARVGEELSFAYAGMRTMILLVEDVTTILNVDLTAEVNQLDEVVVSKTVLKSQKQLSEEYTTNRHLINSAYGILDEETAPGKISILTQDDMVYPGLCILDLVRARFSGVQVWGDCITGGTITIRNAGTSSINNVTSTIFDVDGQIFTETPLWILPENIERIAVLSSRSVATRYGAIGAGGVVIINTKVGNNFRDNDTGKPYDYARLRNNKFENNALSAQEAKKNQPKYLVALSESTSEAEAKTLFQEQAASYRNSFHYFLDAYAYFSRTWNNKKFAQSIIEDNRTLFDANPVALKALAYYYQADGMYKEANEVYKDIFILRPNYAQSYMDIAGSHREIGEYRKAAGIYTRYGYLVEQGFIKDEGELGTIMDRELNSLIVQQGDEFLDRTELAKAVVEDDLKGTRLVFEWNDNQAEFELQFVNPEGDYFKSEHSMQASMDRIVEKRMAGFSCEEHFIDESLPGRWQININYLGNKSLTPTYLKVDIYRNYGYATQSKETKVFKLHLRNVNQELFKLTVNPAIVSN